MQNGGGSGGGVVIIQPTDGMYMDASMYYVI